MKLNKSEIIITFLVGFAASAISNGAPMVLLSLMTLLAAGSVVWMCLDLTLKMPKVQLTRFLTRVESSTPNTPRKGYLLGVGHRVGR